MLASVLPCVEMPNMEQLMAASKKDGVGGALGTNGEIAGHGLDESVVATGHERTADPQVGQRGIGEFYRRARVAVELCNGVGKTTVLEYHLAIADRKSKRLNSSH